QYDTFKELVASFRLFAALCSKKGSKPREQLENLVMKRRDCIDTLGKISKEYRSRSDDLRLVLEISERECISDDGGKKRY
ncbi:17634_t:CDS:1, partial [Acaulospora morrowiae]